MRRFILAVVLVALSAVASRAEFVAKDDTFRCLTSGTKVEGKNFYVFNKSRVRLRKALRIANQDLPLRHYPIGTVLQFFPREAMVKRGGRFNRDGGGWEFFKLDVSPAGTTIVERGGIEITNVSGSCQGCHAAAKQFDFVCEGHDVAQLKLSPDIIKLLQNDPRCPIP